MNPKECNLKEGEGETPLLTVVMPCFNERATIREIITRVLAVPLRLELIVVQDADLEYDPAELPELYEPIRQGRADVVFGTRFFGGKLQRVHMFWH